MNPERGLVCSIVLDEDLEYVLEKSITAEFFSDDDANTEQDRKVFQLILDHFIDHGKVPGVEVVKKAYPNYEVTRPPERLKYYADLVRDDHLKGRLSAGLTGIVGSFEEDYLEGADGGERLFNDISQMLMESRLEVPVGEDHDLFGSGWDRMKTELEKRKKRGGVMGIPTGFDGIDSMTGGLQNERLITLFGLPKSGKSSVLLRIGMNAALYGARTVFVTFEMSNEEQRDRAASLLGRIPLNNIMKGDLLPKEAERLEKAWKRLESMSGFFTLVEDRNSMTNLDGVQAKISKFKPKLVIVDGAYMMEDQYGEPPGSPRALTNITRGMKRLAQNNGIPVMMSTQALHQKSKGGLSASSVGYSSSFEQDSDQLIGVESLKDAPGYSELKLLASRTSGLTSTFIHMGWDQGVIEEVPEALIPQAKPQQGGPTP